MTLDEMDRLAGEKVLGPKYRLIGGSLCFQSPSCLPHEWLKKHDNWQPSRNIQQAWECLSHWKDIRIEHACNSDKWQCWVWCEPEHCEFSAEEDTAPLAIVKACLKAKGIEIE